MGISASVLQWGAAVLKDLCKVTFIHVHLFPNDKHKKNRVIYKTSQERYEEVCLNTVFFNINFSQL